MYWTQGVGGTHAAEACESGVGIHGAMKHTQHEQRQGSNRGKGDGLLQVVKEE